MFGHASPGMSTLDQTYSTEPPRFRPSSTTTTTTIKMSQDDLSLVLVEDTDEQLKAFLSTYSTEPSESPSPTTWWHKDEFVISYGVG